MVPKREAAPYGSLLSQGRLAFGSVVITRSNATKRNACFRSSATSCAVSCDPLAPKRASAVAGKIIRAQTREVKPGVPRDGRKLEFVRRAESAPVPAIDADRHVDLAHHDGLAVAHVAGVALDQIGAQVAAGGEARGIVEDAAVWAGFWGSDRTTRGVRGRG